MEKKEYHRANLPHYQQSGQAFFVTWCLHDAIPPKALETYTNKLKHQKEKIDVAIKDQSDDEEVSQLRLEYNIVRKQMMKAMEEVMDNNHQCSIDLSNPKITEIVISSLLYWENKCLRNHAICIMSNHVHWVFYLYEKDQNNNTVWMQDVLQSVKRFSANQINKQLGTKGSVWQKESWDTTIRNDRHLYEAIEYTKRNPVAAGLVTDWQQWPGTVIR